MSYSPKPTPATIQREAQQYLASEFRKLKDTLDVVEIQTFDQLAAEPTRLVDGMLAYADGSNWNPGKGEGLYARVGGAWELASSDLDAAANENITGNWTLAAPTLDGPTLNATVTLANGANTLAFTGSGSIADITASGFTRLDFEGLTVIDIQGSNLRIRDASEGADYATFSHDGTNFNLDLTSTTLFHVTGAGTGYLFDDGTYLSFRPDGTAAQNPGLTYTTADHAISLASTTDGDSLAFTLYNQDGSANPRAAFFMDDTLGEYGLCQTWSSGAQLRFVIASAGSAELVGDWASNLFYTRNGNKLRVYDSGNTDYVELYHNGTDAYFNGVNANWLRIGNLGSGILTLNGPEQRWYDSDNSDSIKIRHSGSHGHLHLGNKGGDDNGIVIYPETSGPNRSGIFCATRGFADDATGTFALPNNRDAGFVWIVCSGTSSAESVEGAHFYFRGTTMVDLGSGSNWALGSGSNPNTDGLSNVWRSGTGILSIKNRRSAFRYYAVYAMFGD